MGDDNKKKDKGSDDLLSQWLDFAQTEENPTVRSEDALTEGRLSFGQERLYFLQTVFPDNPFYHYAELYRFTGNVDADLLIEALKMVIQAHDILHTTFKSREGKVIQVVEDIAPEIIRLDETYTYDHMLATVATKYARRPFDIENGPLVRVVTLPTTDGLAVLICMHHIITDKWSMRVIRKDWSGYYHALKDQGTYTPDTDALRYIDYSENQRKTQYSKEDLSYWQQKLKDCPPEMAIDHDFSRPKRPTYQGQFVQKDLDSSLSSSVLSLAKTMGVTPYVMLLSVFKILLSRHIHSSDIVVGSPVSNRHDEALENAIGFFNETLVLRSDIDEGHTFKKVLKTVESTVMQAFDHSKLPFEALVSELKPPRRENVNPFFQAMFLYHDVPDSPSFGDNINLEYEPFDLGVSKFDLTLYVSNNDGNLSVIIEYSTDLFAQWRIDQMLDQYVHLLHQAVDHPDHNLAQLSILSPEEKNKSLTRLAGPTKTLSHKTVLDAFDHCVAHHSEMPAVSFGQATLSYAELDEKASRIAGVLKENGIGPDQGVGLMTTTNMDMITGLIGILKAGGYYIPIDPGYPVRRQHIMLEDSRVKVVLTNTNIEAAIGDLDVQPIDISSLENAPGKAFEPVQNSPDDLAYMIYTSGSTGRPKAVKVSHRNLYNSTEARVAYYGPEPCTFLLMSSYAFDSSVAGIFWSLYSGGHLIIKPERAEQDVQLLADLIRHHKVTATLMLPSLYEVLLQNANSEDLKSLTAVIVAGEACSPAVVNTHAIKLPQTVLYNEYGPTEATVWSTVALLKAEGPVVSIGRPILNTRAYVQDGSGRVLPPGVRGELSIAGENVTRGYFQRPELTDKKFVDDLLVSAEKMYKTGDLVKYDDQGQIFFLGRVDNQVKIRGHRIELSAVDAFASEHPDLETSVTHVFDQDGVQRYVMFYLGKGLSDKGLRDFLLERIPRYMVPDHLVAVDELPRLPNGKVDLKTLTGPDYFSLGKEADASKPLTAKEEVLSGIWCQILGLKSVGPHDNFFSLGGDSIKSIQLSALARQKGYDLKPNAVFSHQTLEELADSMIKTGEENHTMVSGSAPMLPIHHWFFTTHVHSPDHWGQAYHVRLKSPISATQMEEVISSLLKHHDGLRACFLKDQNSISIPAFEGKLDSIWLKQAGTDDLNKAVAHAMRQMSIAEGNLFRIMTIGSDPYPEMVLMAHHLVIDAYSWTIIFNDLDQLMNEPEKKLPSKTSSLIAWSESLAKRQNSMSADYWTSFNYMPNEWEETFIPQNVPTEVTAQTVITDLTINSALWSAGVENKLKLKKHEFVLSVILGALSSFSKSKQITLDLEATGRQVNLPGKNISRTAGWLTSLYALPFDKQSEFENLTDFIIHVKERYRSVPFDGIDYGQLLYNDQSAFTGASETGPRLTFNYLPAMYSIEEHQAFDNPVFLSKGVRDPKSERDSTLEINVFEKLESWQLHMTFDTQSLSEKWMTTFQQKCIAFAQSIEDILMEGDSRVTPSDFPDADIDQDDLDFLMDQFE